MPRYKVEITETRNAHVIVDADSEDAARDAAFEIDSREWIDDDVDVSVYDAEIIEEDTTCLD
jgi:hypothetical protein